MLLSISSSSLSFLSFPPSLLPMASRSAPATARAPALPSGAAVLRTQVARAVANQTAADAPPTKSAATFAGRRGRRVGDGKGRQIPKLEDDELGFLKAYTKGPFVRQAHANGIASIGEGVSDGVALFADAFLTTIMKKAGQIFNADPVASQIGVVHISAALRDWQATALPRHPFYDLANRVLAAIALKKDHATAKRKIKADEKEAAEALVNGHVTAADEATEGTAEEVPQEGGEEGEQPGMEE